MAETLDIGDPPIRVLIKKSARARRFSLRISNVDGAVSLTMPKRAALRDAVTFAQDHDGWMRKHLGKRPDQIVPTFGGRILLDGLDVPITQGTGRKVRYEAGVFYVPGTEAQVPAKLRAFYKTLARDRLAEASERYAALVGRSFSRITLRDTRSR